MPTLLRVGPYRFQMVMFDCLERPHVHVRGGSIGEAKVWLTPSISVADSWGYTPREVTHPGDRDSKRGGPASEMDPSLSGDGGMTPVRITAARVDDASIEFALSDGRVISAPVTWSRRLVAATAAERADYSISPSGTIVEWPAIDEHIALWSMLRIPEQVVLDAAGFERATGPASA